MAKRIFHYILFGLLWLGCFSLAAYLDSKTPKSQVATITSSIFYPDTYCTVDYRRTWVRKGGKCRVEDDPEASK